MMHSSFKSLGPVPGGIETVIQGLLLAIGADGTLLMPALSSALRPPAIFDLLATPARVGAIPEFFRTRPGTLRSLHPTHSVCAAGRRAVELLADHELDCTPCGPHSPFRRVVESGGRIVMLGCGLRPNTTMHALEEHVGPPYLFGGSYLFTLRDRHGQILRKEYRTHEMAARGIVQRYDRVSELPEASAFLARGRVLQAETYVLDAAALKPAVLARMRTEPCFFVDRVAT
jgi:aminoglycoside 3-N-acetyltransferase